MKANWISAICGQVLLSVGIGLWAASVNGTFISFFTGWFVSGGICAIASGLIATKD